MAGAGNRLIMNSCIRYNYIQKCVALLIENTILPSMYVTVSPLKYRDQETIELQIYQFCDIDVPSGGLFSSVEIFVKSSIRPPELNFLWS